MRDSENDMFNNVSPAIFGGKPYIICAAIWIKDGKKYIHQPRNIESGLIIAGRRHHNCYLTACPDGDFTKIKGFENVQGFLTSDDRFLNRAEAAKLAIEIGQIQKYTECLFSEDLY